MLKRAAVVLALGGIALLARTTRLAAFEEHQAHERYEDVYYLPPANWLPAVSLGYTSAAADLLWCRSLVYFGEEIGQRGNVRHLFQYMDAVIALDPTFRAAYRWAATGIIYRPVPPTIDEVTRGADYLRRAVERWPNDGELRWDLGSYLRFELAPMVKNDPARKDRLLLEAAPHLHVAGIKGAGPPWLALNNATLLSRLGKKEQAIRQLEEVYATVSDEETRSDIMAKLTQLRSESYAEAVQVAVEQFEREREASFPYMSPDLFLLLGPKVSPGYPAAIAEHFAPPDMRSPASGEDM
ncbi:MAG: hypothetical protein QM778_05095 [Myxococcales bacterium]